MEPWVALLLSLVLGGGGYGAYLYTGRKVKPLPNKAYQEPFDFLDTHEKAKANYTMHQEWLVEFHDALTPKDRLIAEGYVPGTISTSEARLLENLYATDKVAFAKYVKQLNTKERLYNYGSKEHKMLQDIEAAFIKRHSDLLNQGDW